MRHAMRMSILACALVPEFIPMVDVSLMIVVNPGAPGLIENTSHRRRMIEHCQDDSEHITR